MGKNDLFVEDIDYPNGYDQIQYIECYTQEYDFICDLADKLETSEAHVILMLRNMAIDKIFYDKNGNFTPLTEDEELEKWREEM